MLYINIYEEFIKNSNSIIFLDIDGVLKPYNKEYNKSIYFNKECVNNLNKIISITNSDIVVTSNWRFKYNLNELKKIFRINKVIKSSIDYTIKLSNKPAINNQLIDIRTKEINKYIKDHKIINYCIIDDYNIKYNENNFELIDKNMGLEKKHIATIIKKLQNIKIKEPWEELYNIGKEYIKINKFEKAEIVGSIIRAKFGQSHPIIKDIDIVVLDTNNRFKGKRVIYTKYKNNIINLFIANTEDEYLTTRLHFIMGKGIIAWKSKAKQKGYKLTRYGLFDKNDNLVSSNPKEIMNIIGINTKLESLI